MRSMKSRVVYGECLNDVVFFPRGSHSATCLYIDTLENKCWHLIWPTCVVRSKAGRDLKLIY